LNSKQISREERWLLEEKYAGKETDAYKADVERLRQGEPLAYVIGWTPFLEQTIFLGSRPLIPRVETEYWVERALEYIARTYRDSPITVLDIFAGSGAIGVATLAKLSNVSVDFAEIEKEHIATIKKNIIENGLSLSKARCIVSDVWSDVDGVYDVIFANPPYIGTKSKNVADSVKDFEPARALFAEKNGIALIESFVRGVDQHLSERGVFWCEHDPEQTEEVVSLIENEGFLSNVWIDQYGNQRVTVGRRSV